jgi:hypothetical protein
MRVLIQLYHARWSALEQHDIDMTKTLPLTSQWESSRRAYSSVHVSFSVNKCLQCSYKYDVRSIHSNDFWLAVCFKDIDRIEPIQSVVLLVCY